MQSARLNPLDLVIPLVSVVAALGAGMSLVALSGKSPTTALLVLWDSAVGDVVNFGASVARAVPLIFAALGVAFAFRSGVFNIGAEGQLFLAAAATTWVATGITGLPKMIHLPLAVLAGVVVAGFWAVIPGVLKARRGFNEVIITILMNYIAYYFVSYLVRGPLRNPTGTLPQSAPVPVTAQLPILVPGTELHGGALLTLAVAALLYWILFHTTFGFQVRAVGQGHDAARTAGMPVTRVVVLSMLISGGVAGLAGTCEVLGFQHRLIDNFATQVGYDAIAVALLGRLHPLGIIAAGLFFGALRNGATGMQILAGVPVTIVQVIQAVIILAVLIGSSGQIRPLFKPAVREGDPGGLDHRA